LTSLKDDAAATKRAIDDQGGRTLLVGHSWAGAVIAQAGTANAASSLSAPDEQRRDARKKRGN
jgi:hypothetical protein